MSRPDPASVRHVAIIGSGVIGGGWAAHFLRLGLDVTAYDPALGAEDRLRQMVADTWPALERIGLAGGADPARLTFAADSASAVADAEFVQESTPENGPRKAEVLAAIDAAAPPHVVIASSTSGFAMTMLQQRCKHPERCVVGHPFNPPYLIPLVEVVGGERTDPAVVDWAVAFYSHFDKYALKMTKELPGFIGNRLQEAIWREALHMVGAGEATVEEIDASITFGPGLRWALMGPCLTYHLAGGEEGMAYMLEHFGPALLEPWTRLEAPELTPDLREQMIQGCLREADGRSIRELENQRDEFLIELLDLVKRHQAKHGVPGLVAPDASPARG